MSPKVSCLYLCILHPTGLQDSTWILFFPQFQVGSIQEMLHPGLAFHSGTDCDTFEWKALIPKGLGCPLNIPAGRTQKALFSCRPLQQNTNKIKVSRKDLYLIRIHLQDKLPALHTCVLFFLIISVSFWIQRKTTGALLQCEWMLRPLIKRRAECWLDAPPGVLESKQPDRQLSQHLLTLDSSLALEDHTPGETILERDW